MFNFFITNDMYERIILFFLSSFFSRNLFSSQKLLRFIIKKNESIRSYKICFVLTFLI